MSNLKIVMIIIFKSTKRLPEEETKYIVFQSNLLELFEQCPACMEASEANIIKCIGTFIRVKQVF